MNPFTKILVAIDFSDTSKAALAYGRALAGQFGAKLHVVHVVEDFAMKSLVSSEGFARLLPEVQRELEEAACKQLKDTLQHEPGVAESCVITSNAPADAIVDYAKNVAIDLIVLGTHGRGGVSRLLLGSVAERVVRTAPCPVLTVRHVERESILEAPAGTPTAAT
jgi:nucleotide-binding universal stress UspA family protein